jgi:hypothetical protein
MRTSLFSLWQTAQFVEYNLFPVSRSALEAEAVVALPAALFSVAVSVAVLFVAVLSVEEFSLVSEELQAENIRTPARAE